MSKHGFIYRPCEVVCDKEGNIINEHETDLPHFDMIRKEMEDNWNSMHMEQYFDGILKDKIAECTLKFINIGLPYPTALINAVGVPRFRFTEKVRNEIDEQIFAQLVDGWGEGFFGPVNIMTAPDGTRFYVE